jgi:hypothetical protein
MTMTTEETVAPEQTQNAPDAAKPAPEVAELEVNAEAKPDAEPSEKDDAERARKAMQRRIDRQTANLYRERAEKEHLAQRLAEYESRSNSQPEQQAGQIDPVALAREIATVEKVTEKSNDIAKDGEKRFGKDFGAAIATVVEEAGPLFDKRGMPTAIGDAILDADDPAALLHHLGRNPDLADELQGLSPARLGRRVAQIEAQMQAKPKPVSGAPAPVKPIAGGTSNANPANMSMAEYKALRKAQGASWAR